MLRKLSAIVLAALCAGCGVTGTTTTTTTTATTTVTSVPSPPPTSNTCPTPAHTLDGVYHPNRLQVLDPCKTLTVTVMGFRHEFDGDIHIYTKPSDPNFTFKPGAGGYFIVEYMPRDGGHLPPPYVGEQMTVTGAYNLDGDHGWNEMHPIFKVVLSDGSTYISGPQFGGSPPNDSSSNAAADCKDLSGNPCIGYPGLTTGRVFVGVQPKGDSRD